MFIFTLVDVIGMSRSVERGTERESIDGMIGKEGIDVDGGVV